MMPLKNVQVQIDGAAWLKLLRGEAPEIAATRRGDWRCESVVHGKTAWWSALRGRCPRQDGCDRR
jgi:hypothetical protein